MYLTQFRDYIFKHNPERISVSYSNAVAEHFLPGLGAASQFLGRRLREIKCEGCFAGAGIADALAEAGEFRRKCNEKSGVLRIPGMEPMRARIKEIALDLSGDGRIIPYTILFIETEEE